MRRKPSLEHARHYLTGLIGEMETNRRTRLPTIKNMARSARISHGAMGQAIEQLRRDGIVEVRTRRGIHLARAEGPATSPQDPTGFRWQRLKSELREEIMDGRLTPLALRSRKEMADRHRVSQKTLLKSLRALVDEGVLSIEGKTYRRTESARPGQPNTIILFTRSKSTGEISTFTPRTRVQFSALEHACHAHKVQLTIVGCDYTDPATLSFPGWRSASFAQKFGSDRIAGFMVWQLGLADDFVQQLMEQIRLFGKPMVLLCEGAEESLMRSIPIDGLVRQYAICADFEAGLSVGRFLTANGHKHVCCWVGEGGHVWVRNRLAGIKEAFCQAGYRDGVELFAAFDNTAVDFLADRSLTLLELSNDIGGIIRKWGTEPRHSQAIEHASEFLVEGIFAEHVFNRLQPLMRQKLADKGITAWIGMNDAIALECLGFLKANAVDVPRRISVIGFDDGFEAAARLLSSYNFNGVAAVNRMVDFILSPHSPVTRSVPGKPVRVHGYVHERTTTGVARMGPD